MGCPCQHRWTMFLGPRGGIEQVMWSDFPMRPHYRQQSTASARRRVQLPGVTSSQPVWRDTRLADARHQSQARKDGGGRNGSGQAYVTAGVEYQGRCPAFFHAAIPVSRASRLCSAIVGEIGLQHANGLGMSSDHGYFLVTDTRAGKSVHSVSSPCLHQAMLKSKTHTFPSRRAS